MIALNHHLFLLLNAPADASTIVVWLATVLANDIVYLIPLLLVALWVWSASSVRAGLLVTSTMAMLALVANQIVGQFWYAPPPFMIGLGRTLLNHVPENSFPSDHTTLIVSVGIGLLATGAARRLGAAVIAPGTEDEASYPPAQSAAAQYSLPDEGGPGGSQCNSDRPPHPRALDRLADFHD